VTVVGIAVPGKGHKKFPETFPTRLSLDWSLRKIRGHGGRPSFFGFLSDSSGIILFLFARNRTQIAHGALLAVRSCFIEAFPERKQEGMKIPGIGHLFLHLDKIFWFNHVYTAEDFGAYGFDWRTQGTEMQNPMVDPIFLSRTTTGLRDGG
jgi:hypothetical protein